MTDFWHPDADPWRVDAWEVIRDCRNIIWLMLTKRPERIPLDLPADWDSNFKHCWLGTTQWAAHLYDKTRESGVKFFWKQVAAPKNEWGSNALGLYLGERDGVQVDPASVDLVREFPDTLLPLMPLDREKGHRLTAAQWERHKQQNSAHSIRWRMAIDACAANDLSEIDSWA